jgi:hypothetical protein
MAYLCDERRLNTTGVSQPAGQKYTSPGGTLIAGAGSCFHAPNASRFTFHASRLTHYGLRITHYELHIRYIRSPTPIGIITNPLMTLG